MITQHFLLEILHNWQHPQPFCFEQKASLTLQHLGVIVVAFISLYPLIINYNVFRFILSTVEAPLTVSHILYISRTFEAGLTTRSAFLGCASARLATVAWCTFGSCDGRAAHPKCGLQNQAFEVWEAWHPFNMLKKLLTVCFVRFQFSCELVWLDIRLDD